MKLSLTIVCFGVLDVLSYAANVGVEAEEDVRASLNPLCEVCELAIEEIYKEIGKETSEEKVKDAVHHVCNKIPQHYREKCNDFVTKHGDQVIKLVEEVATPKHVCELVRACLI